MSLFKDDPPTPPNPTATAGAQTATNVSTAIANAFLNNTNQQTPLGSLEYLQSGNYSFTDPTTGSSYDIPRFTAKQNLSGPEQGIQDYSESAKYNLAQVGNTLSNQLKGYLPQGIDYSKVTPFGDPSRLAGVPDAATAFGDAGTQQTGFGEAGDVTRDYGPADNFSADRARVEGSLFGRLNPQLDRQRQQIEQRLADQGIRYGSPAYTAAMDDYSRQANDLRLGVTAAGGAEQQRMNDMAAQRAGFQNAAQMQEYQQQQGRGQFANQAQQNQFTQAASRGQFTNAGLAQLMAQRQALLSTQDTQRGAQLAEAYAARNQPINEIASLLSGAQISQPSFMQTHMGTIPTTDIAGLTNQNFAQNLDIFKTQSANQTALLGGILGLGGNAIRASDVRVKDDIARMGTVFAVNDDGDRKELPIYQYAYKDDPASTRHIGPMAQDVEKIDRGAVRTIGGVKHIHTGRVMGSILRAA